MDTWKECAWFQCRKRFEPSKRSNRFYRADGPHHEGRTYCSRSCQQKAYRLRRNSRTVTPEGTDTLRTVTRPSERIENKREFSTKNGHSRPPKVVAGPAEKYSERSLRAAAMPLDPATAEYQRQANNADRIRAETAWGRRSVSAPDGYVVSDWKPCLPSDHATLPDLTIPAFLRRTA
jgi:hypothetical protein